MTVPVKSSLPEPRVRCPYCDNGTFKRFDFGMGRNGRTKINRTSHKCRNCGGRGTLSESEAAAFRAKYAKAEGGQP